MIKHREEHVEGDGREAGIRQNTVWQGVGGTCRNEKGEIPLKNKANI